MSRSNKKDENSGKDAFLILERRQLVYVLF